MSTEPHPTRPRFWPHGLRAVLRVPGEATRGAYALLEVEAPPGCTVAAHVHRHEDEQIVVLDGAVDITCEGVRTRHAPGGSVVLPAGRPHHLATEHGARFLWLFRPAGVEEVLGKLAGGALDDDDVSALLAGAGITVLPGGVARRPR